MARSSFALGALLLLTVSAWSATSLTLGADWYPVGSRFTELTTFEVIRLRHGALTWNRVPIGKADVLNYVRQVALLEPRPRVCLYFSRNDHAEALLLAKEIRDVGGCDGGGCLFKVTVH
jgi:hypothetical protein